VLRVIELWTDGSGSTGDAPAGWAFVLRHVDAGGKISDLLNGGRLERGTNNVAELTAVIEGLRALKRSCSLTIVTDSEYVMKGFTEDRVADWRNRGWKTAAGKPVANQDLWEALAAEVVQHDITWRHVRGHVGHELNELADQVAGMMRRWEIEAQNENDPPAGTLGGSLEDSGALRGDEV
jgi:ribonuclease HI